MRKVLKSTYERILPALFWLTLMLAFDSVYICVITCICAAAHEVGHIGAAIAVRHGGVSISKATLTGLKIHTGGILSYKEELIIASGGPIANLVFFLFCLPFFDMNEYFVALGVINLLTAFSNLIPIRGYDGYRIIGSALSLFDMKWRVDDIMSALTVAFSAAATLISLVLLMLVGEGYWFFAIFFAVLLKEILKKH